MNIYLAVPDPTSPEQPGPSQTTVLPSIDELSELPFQLCLTYTDLEGAKAMRVISQSRPVTKDRSQAEKGDPLTQAELLNITLVQTQVGFPASRLLRLATLS